jgi:hypothetical protein
MTIGIATTCDFGTDDPKVILCSDWQVTSELGAAQTHFKEYRLAKGWHCLYAGSPLLSAGIGTWFQAKID